MPFSEHELRRRFPNISASTLRANSAPDPAPSPKPQRPVRDEPLATPAREKGDMGRVIVRIKSFRCRLLDPDNLAGGTKYFTDGLRYAGLIRDDSPQDIILEVSQEKVATRKEERTQIEIEPMPVVQTTAVTTPRQKLIEELWLTARHTWNRVAFDVFCETLSTADLQQQIQAGRA